MKKIVEVEYYIDEIRKKIELDWKGDEKSLIIESEPHGPFPTIDKARKVLAVLVGVYGQTIIIKSEFFEAAKSSVDNDQAFLTKKTTQHPKNDLSAVRSVHFKIREQVVSETPVAWQEYQGGN